MSDDIVKLRHKVIDFTKNFKYNLLFVICCVILIAIELEIKLLLLTYILIITTIFTVSFNMLLQVGFYYLYFKTTIEFKEDCLLILFNKKCVKIYYNNIKSIIIRKNIFHSNDVMINFYYRTEGLFSLYSDYIYTKNNNRIFLLPKVKNSEEILEKILIKKEILEIENEKYKMEYKISIFSRYPYIIFLILFMGLIITRLEIIFIFLIIINFSIRKRNLNLKKTGNSVLIYGKNVNCYVFRSFKIIRGDVRLMLLENTIFFNWMTISTIFIPIKFKIIDYN